MHNKKPDIGALIEGSRNFDERVVAASPEVVEQYLSTLNFEAEITEERDRNVYRKFRSILMGSLGERTRKDFLFAALIERIARSAVMLERIEKLLMSKNLSATMLFNANMKMDYIKLQEEHRKCIETFANLKFAQERHGKVKVLEELRKIVHTEDSE